MAKKEQKVKYGFTLVELLLVISIISMLASIILASLDTSRKKARDVRRLADMHTIQNALEVYYSDNKVYPAAVNDGPSPTCTPGNWDCSHVGNFINALVPQYLPQTPLDPLNNTTYHYSYWRGASPAFNCTDSRGKYLVGIKAFELTNNYYNPNFCQPGAGTFGWVGGSYE